jgi:hypothetical protein
MKTYDITMQAIITKTITVQANNDDDAYELACEGFSDICFDLDEHYEQDCISLEEVTA